MTCQSIPSAQSLPLRAVSPWLSDANGSPLACNPDDGAHSPDLAADAPTWPAEGELLDAFSRVEPGVVARIGPAVVRLDAAHDNRADGSGSGVIVAPDGLILTNHHVVGSRSRVKATTAEGMSLTARVVGIDDLIQLLTG